MPCIRATQHAARNLTCNVLSVPAFLCPALLRSPKPELFSQSIVLPKRQAQITIQVSRLHTGIQSAVSAVVKGSVDLALLPVSCPGCGAFVQNIEPHAAGFYSTTKKAFKLQKQASILPKSGIEDAIYESALRKAENTLLQEMGLASSFTLGMNVSP